MNGKTIVATGATSGIGEVAVLALAGLGLSALNKQWTEANFDDQLGVYLKALVANVAIPNDETKAGAPAAIAPQFERTGKDKPDAPKAKTPFIPKLYNLDADIGERTDVAARHPEMVKRLQGFVARMDADLGVTKPGPGVRPPGRVQKPKPLLLK